MFRKLLTVSSACAAMALVASGCGVGSDKTVTSTSTATRSATTVATKPIGGGSAKCTNAEVQKALDGVAGGKPAVLVSSTCADGWMVLLAAVNGPDSPPSTFVFEAEGPYWIPQNRTKVCMPPSPVPKQLQQIACAVN